MQSLHHQSIDHPYRTLILAALVLLAITPGVMRLKLRTDGLALLPRQAPEIVEDLRIRDEFGLEDPLVILIRSRHPDGAFNPGTLQLARDLTHALGNLAEIDTSSVLSLTTELSHRVWPGTLAFRPYLVPFPKSADDFVELRDDFRRIELYSGTLIGKDERAIAIQVGVPAGIDRPGLCANISELIAAMATETDEILLIGAPVAEALLGTHILSDLGVPGALLGAPSAVRVSVDGEGDGFSGDGPTDGRPSPISAVRRAISRTVGLVPLAILIMALVFLVAFRDWRAVVLPIIEIGACIWFVFGTMGWLGIPIYLTTTVLPVILTAIGTADEIHIFTHYAQRRRAQPSEGIVDAVTGTLDEISGAVVKTSVTTAIGFLSFAASPIEPVRMFGVFMALGIATCMVWSLTVVPAMLVLLRPRGFARTGEADVDAPTTTTGRTAVSSLLARAGLAVRRRRRIVIGFAVLLFITVPIGIGRVTVQDSWIEGFAPESEFYRATAYFNQQFCGAHILYALVNTGNRRVAGEVRGDWIGHHEVKIPTSLIGATDSLAGSTFRLMRTARDSARLLSAERWRPPSARPRLLPWESRVQSTEVIGDTLLLRLSRRSGSPALSFRPGPTESLRFEIQDQRLLQPHILTAIGDFERFVEGLDQYAVGCVIGPVEYVATTNFIIGQRREEFRRVPDDPANIARLWNNYGRVRGAERLRQAVDVERQQAIVTILMNDANFVDTRELMAAIRDYAGESLEPIGMDVTFAGDVATSQALIEGIVKTQTRSLMFSLVSILVISLFLTRSVRLSLCFVIPCTLAVAGNFAAMGWTGMPLGVATSMFAGMTLGIGVDFAIHLVERYRLAIKRGPRSDPALTDEEIASSSASREARTRAALTEALSTAGPAILIDGVAIALGFGVLLLSQVPANSRLGELVMISIFNCMLFTLILLPAVVPSAASERPGGND